MYLYQYIEGRWNRRVYHLWDVINSHLWVAWASGWAALPTILFRSWRLEPPPGNRFLGPCHMFWACEQCPIFHVNVTGFQLRTPSGNQLLPIVQTLVTGNDPTVMSETVFQNRVTAAATLWPRPMASATITRTHPPPKFERREIAVLSGVQLICICSGERKNSYDNDSTVFYTILSHQFWIFI